MGCYKCGSEQGNEARLCPSCNQKKRAEIDGHARTAMSFRKGQQSQPSSYDSRNTIKIIVLCAVLAVVAIAFLVVRPAPYELPLQKIVTNSSLVTISRSKSDFLYNHKGMLAADFKVFGFNPNPFGSNNKVEYVESFGPSLLITHVLVVTGKDIAAQTFARDHCERALSGQMTMLPIIVKSPLVGKELDAIASAGNHQCVHLEGAGLEFTQWIVEGRLQTKEVLGRITLQAGGIDFAKPVLLDKITVVSCE
jgi:hypothetical protein